MDYQGNTDKSKLGAQPKPEKNVEKVITGEVITREPSFGKKFKGVFFGGEFKNSMKYIAADVLLPAFRNLIVDATTKGMERIVFGESSYHRRRPEFRSRVQYNSPVMRQLRDPRERAYLPDQPPYPYRTARREAHEVILSSREEAEKVLEALIDIVEKYEVASLADLLELCGQPSAHTDNKWGWAYLHNAEIRQIRDGYLLELPTMEPI